VSTIFSKPDWYQLFRIAYDLIQQVNSEQLIIDDWTLGGGTAMMLQIDHRESQDIDIFLSDPQVLPFLDPQKRDFHLRVPPIAYRGDGVQFLKLAFGALGNIDFIVAPALTRSSTTETTVDGKSVSLETVPEIITKKIFYRGSNPKPRDIFDVAAAGKPNDHADRGAAKLSNAGESSACFDREAKH